MGAREIRVGEDKVTVKMLKVKVVSGMDVNIVAEDALPGILTARIVTKSRLVKQSQVTKNHFVLVY